MDIEKEFQDWYDTEGIRTTADAEKHWHESYCENAFRAGAYRAFVYARKLIDKLETSIKNEKRNIGQ